MYINNLFEYLWWISFSYNLLWLRYLENYYKFLKWFRLHGPNFIWVNNDTDSWYHPTRNVCLHILRLCITISEFQHSINMVMNLKSGRILHYTEPNTVVAAFWLFVINRLILNLWDIVIATLWSSGLIVFVVVIHCVW